MEVIETAAQCDMMVVGFRGVSCISGKEHALSVQFLLVLLSDCAKTICRKCEAFNHKTIPYSSCERLGDMRSTFSMRICTATIRKMGIGGVCHQGVYFSKMGCKEHGRHSQVIIF